MLTFLRNVTGKAMSQIKHKLLDSDDETLQAILRAVVSVQRETGFGSIEITVHEGRITQIEKREKFRITHDKSEKQSFDKQGFSGQNPEKPNLEKDASQKLSIKNPKSELSKALHN